MMSELWIGMATHTMKSNSNHKHWKELCNPSLGVMECGPILATFREYAVAVHNGIYQLLGEEWIKIGDMH